MKKVILFFILTITNALFCLNSDTTITKLRGMEDQTGNTHLFYRIYSSSGDNIYGGFNESIYHFNLTDNSDRFFLSSGGYWNPSVNQSTNVYDFEFWHNDPSKYIYFGFGCGIDCAGFIKRYDSEPFYGSLFFFNTDSRLAISSMNDSTIYSTGGRSIVKSTDGGRSWYISDSTDYMCFLSLSPYNDNEIYGLDSRGYIEKSSDGGRTFSIVDTTSSSIYSDYPVFCYDNDSLHVYRISYVFENNEAVTYLSFSKNKGENGSWIKKYSGSNPFYISVDNSISGTIYLADGNNVLISTDYGNTFNIYKKLSGAIVGIYKKPGSDKLYAATNSDIFEITSSSIKSIKHLVTLISNKPRDIPENFLLYQNFPNPFNPSTTINYEIPKPGLVQLKIFDILGREVAALVNEEQSAGGHTVVFDSQHLRKQLSSGVYFFRLKFGSKVLNKKMILLR